jgi:hypothetical protein
MTDAPSPAPGSKAFDEQVAAAVAGMITNTIRQVSGQTEALQTAIIALSTILVVTPSTAQLSDERLAVIAQALVGKKDTDEPLRAVANYIGNIVTMAKRLNAVMAGIEEKGILADAPATAPADGKNTASRSKATATSTSS